MSEILSIWSEVNFEDRITSENQFHDQCLWYNSLFRINNLPVFYKDWLNKGIRKVKDLKDSHNNFLSLTDFQSKYNLPTCPLKFYGLLSAIKSLWSKCKGLCNQNPKYESFLENFSKSNRASRLIYAKLISKKSIAPTQNQQKWIKDCNEDDKDFDWRKTYLLASKYTKSTRLLEFQFKLLHRRIATNDFLNKVGLKDNSKCSFCGKEQEKLRHLFWECPKVVVYWNSLTALLNGRNIITDNYKLEISVALGLRPDSSNHHHQINFCCLLARYYIWICKKKETAPRIEGFIKYLESVYDIEVKTGAEVPKKWEILKSFF